jgi:hypothetical protein
MRLILAGASILFVRLALASVVLAQVADLDEPVPEPVPLRVEIGAVAGLTAGFPEIGVLASLPIGPRATFDLGLSWLPGVMYQVEHAVAQAQFRLPFRPHLRSRKSLLIGVTRISARNRGHGDSGFWGNEATVVFPHAGASLQWPMGRHADVRFDAQGLFTLDSEFPLVPRAVTTFVWHPGGAR